MKRTRRVKRKPHGTLRKSRRYRRGGYVEPKTFLRSAALAVSHGGKKRKRSSRSKRGGYPMVSQVFYGSRTYSAP